ncbi:putative ATP-dependent RNA helicase DHX57 [Nilaparvata lugens]|uniref:putative ATP-dependent RNA helicase DHX57 n=1 Tax=Nilaparvata lugens TaxID=108931 RepID=UPI00193D1413|nr:putative ATP-dependent RNA helicase DHX57 [Nilaparvata lugens]XP_039293576.1 putative ATP-dependent RNA helicase DHX57 [Nilaparvata lugens]
MTKMSVRNKSGNNRVKNEENFIIPTKKKEEKIADENNVPSKYKVEMTTLYLTDESKKLIEHALKFIHGNNYSLKELSSYKEAKGLELALHKDYRMNSGHLRVRTIENYALQSNKTRQASDIAQQFAITKLKRYGFEANHCSEALQSVEGDFGAAFELLMSRYFHLPLPDPEADTCPLSEAERKQEMEAILSIYDEHFSVKINDRLWAIRLNLPYLAEHYAVKAPVNIVPEKPNPRSKSKKVVCRFFKEGTCRHGVMCKFSHDLPEKTVTKVEVDDSQNWFVLEIRFPKGSKYPLEDCPLVSLVPESEYSRMPAGVRLCLTQHLLGLARQDAAAATPTVFNLASVLQDHHEQVLAAADGPQCFPSPNDSILAPPADAATREQEDEGLTEEDGDSSGETRITQPRQRDVDVEAIRKENVVLSSKYRAHMKTEKSKKWIESRSKLPAWAKRSELLNTIKNNRVVMICGETGCGKSTQVPQFVLEEWLEGGASGLVSIVCSQPRKISAMGVASRVADEKSERVGGLVGYQIHLESCVSRSTRLSFCTTGVLLRRLESDPSLLGVSHIVVDEVHERSEESDFLLLILKQLLEKRKDLKVILMSATANAKLFCDYFGGDVPIIDIPGRTFPVQSVYLEDLLECTNYVLEENSEYTRVRKGKDSNLEELETELEVCDIRTASSTPADKIKDDFLTLQQINIRYDEYSLQTKKNLYLLDPEKINYDLIVESILWITTPHKDLPDDGSILVFLPGIGEITQLHEKLLEQSVFRPEADRFFLVPLHSSLSSEEQKLLFKKMKKGVRKIILSTNIAETSVTVDDCVFVIDTGRMKENRFDENKSMETLESVWVSRANALQRRGRAGRVRAGVAISLYTSHRFNHHMQAQPTPEIHRVSLERVIIRTKMLPLFHGADLRGVLGSLIEPPSETAISAALERLRLAGAVDADGSLTPLGCHCGQLPVDIRLAKLLLYGAIYCCLDSVLTMAASLSYRSPFISTFHNRATCDAKRKEFTTAHSDQITVLKAYNEWRAANEKSPALGRRFAYEKNLSLHTLSHLADVKLQFLEHLVAIGFVDSINIPAKSRRRSGLDIIPELTGQQWNKNGSNNRLLASVLCAALFPNVVRVMTADRTFVPSAGGAVPKVPQLHELRFTTIQGDQVQIHPSSVNHGVCDFGWSPFVVFQEKVRTARVFVRDTSVVPAIALALCSGCPLQAKLHSGGQLLLSLADSAILFSVENNEVAELLQAIQRELGKILEEKIRNPSLNLLNYAKGCKVIDAIIDVVSRS